MTASQSLSGRWLLDPNDVPTRILVQRLTEELLPFDGRLIHELESAVAELNLHDPKEANRKLRSELTEAIVQGKPLELEGGIDPPEIRQVLFASLWERGLSFLTNSRDLFGDAEEIMSSTSRRLNIAPHRILENLYADTPGERRATFPKGDPGWQAPGTIHAINMLRLKQRLRKALGMTLLLPLTVKEHSPYVSVFWLLKREGLMYDGIRSGASARLSIAGPFALFEKTTAYGNRLFSFCRALLSLRNEEWTATIDLMHQSPDGSAQLAPMPLSGSMRRYFAEDTEDPAFTATRSGDEEAFRKYFEKRTTAWTLTYEGALVPIDDPDSPAHRFMVPDFVARHKESGREALIELVGYWRPEYLQRKLSKAVQARSRMIVLLVNRKLLLGRQEAAALEQAGVRVLFYDGREELKDAARVVAEILESVSKGEQEGIGDRV